MTLGSWFRDYVYIPLGGSRVPRGKWMRNLLIVWALTASGMAPLGILSSGDSGSQPS